MSLVRVLIVEDYEPFRRFVRSTLQKRPELQIVAEVSDGLEALQKSEELQPDLILLDIGLPGLNGIEAARRIGKLAPESKIIFLSQESSADVVREALSSGACGYVVKAYAGVELLAAVDAVREGRQFLSRGLSSFTPAMDAQAPDARDNKPVQSLVPGRLDIPRRHEVQFYADDASFLAGFGRFIEAALRSGNAVIVVATESHQKSLLQKLEAQGLNIAFALEQGSYIPLDVVETLSTFMVDGKPAPARFFKVAHDLVAAAERRVKGGRVAACGECAPTLWAQGEGSAAIQLERLWDEIAKTCDVEILCGYVLNSFQRKEENHIYERICAEHSTVGSQ